MKIWDKPRLWALVSSFRSARRCDLPPKAVAVWSEVPPRAGVSRDLQVFSQRCSPYTEDGEVIRGFEETLNALREDLGTDVAHEITTHQFMADVRVSWEAAGSDGDVEMATREGA
jgi:hypothetical protein